jgi:hypothetical protein
MPSPLFVSVGTLTTALGVLGALVVASPPADPEVARLRRHFATVERELVTADVSWLTPAQREARARHVARLREYSRRGVFPRNTDYPGRRAPYFVDRVGTRCAMAYLIEESGAADFVTHVAATRNNAYVAQLAVEPALRAWLDHNGLTVAEAVRIQPAYCGEPFGRPCCQGEVQGPCPDDEPVAEPSTGYRVGTGAAVAGGLTLAAINAAILRPGLPRRTSGWLGVGTGVVGLALGVSKLGDAGELGTLAALNTGVGALAVVLGLHALAGGDETAAARVAPAVRAAPWLAVGRGKRGGPMRAGILARLQF